MTLFSVNAGKETAKEMKIGPFTASGITVAEGLLLTLISSLAFN